MAPSPPRSRSRICPDSLPARSSLTASGPLSFAHDDVPVHLFWRENRHINPDGVKRGAANSSHVRTQETPVGSFCGLRWDLGLVDPQGQVRRVGWDRNPVSCLPR